MKLLELFTWKTSGGKARRMLLIAAIIAGAQHAIVGDAFFTGTLYALIVVSYIQNMSFTWVSRSRQGGDPDYHRFAAWASNGVWAITQAFVAANVYVPINDLMKGIADGWAIPKIILAIVIYFISTAEGSVMMMKVNLGWFKLPKALQFLEEKGNRQVGGR